MTFEIEAWIITNGYNVGIVQLVGQAIKKVKLTKPKERLTAIGLCKWGSVKDIKTLTSDTQHLKKKVRLMFNGCVYIILLLHIENDSKSECS